MRLISSSMNPNAIIWRYDNSNICINDIYQKLKEVTLQCGDFVMIHANTSVFGKIGDIKDQKLFYNTIIDIILAVIGKEGVLIIPSYTYSICRNQEFDICNTKPYIGGLASAAFERYREYLKFNHLYPVFRSEDPIFSCIGFGKNAGIFLKNLGNECFGLNSVFDKIYKYEAKLLCLGFPFAVTYMHYVERCFHNDRKPLKYRYDKNFTGISIDEFGNKKKVTYKYYVRDLEKCNYSFEIIPKYLKEKKILKEAYLGGGKLSLVRATDLSESIYDMLEQDEYAFLRKNKI